MFLLSFFDISFLTTTLICSFFSLFIFYWYKTYYNHFWKNKGITCEKPQSMFAVLCNILFTNNKTFLENDNEIYKKHGTIFGNYEVTNPTLWISDPELVKLILVKDFSNFNRRRADFGDLNELPYFSDFLSAINDNEKWKRVRTVVSPAFTSGKLRGMMNGIENSADQFTQHLMKAADSGEIIDCKKIGGSFAMDAIATVAFGTKLDSHNDVNNVFVQKGNEVFNFIKSWRLILFLVAPRLFLKLRIGIGAFNFFADLTRNIMERRTKNNEHHHDFLQMMIDHLEDSDRTNVDSKKVSMNELVAQCLLFFVAGFDNIATIISMTMHFLALNPEVQKKVLRDVDNYWQNKGVGNDVNTSTEARYLEACISETLRLYPPATRVERSSNTDYPLGDTGFTVPKDMLIQIPVYCIHRDDKYFPEPEKYMPERFLPENADNFNNFAYLPFGNGPRNCVAMRFALLEIKLCLLHVFKHVKFEPCPKTKDPPEISRIIGLLQPKEVFLKVVKR